MEQTPEEQLAPYIIEGARSSRSRCKTCKRKIDKGVLRIGMLIEGPYGIGYMWHHLRCAARRQFERVEEAFAAEAWNEAKEPPGKIPDLESLAKLRDTAEAGRRQRKTIPYAELDPSGRARCKHCGEKIDKGSVRFVLGREVEFGNQVRTAPVQIHPRCVAAEIDSEESNVAPAGFVAAVRENSRDVEGSEIEDALRQVGPLSEPAPD